MIDLKEYVERYFNSLRGILNALPKDATLPAFLSDTSFIIGYSDIKGKVAIQLLSREKVPEIVINGNIFKPRLNSKPGIICFSNARKIEQFIFPQDNKGTSVSISIGQRNTVLNGLAFSSKEYNDKYWSNAKFYRMCAGDIPFSVTKDGVMLGLNLLWGTELGGLREEKVFEYIKIFGSQGLLPTCDKDLQNETFRDFGHSASGLGKELDNWSFTDFILGLETPVERNVLLLGSYKSDDEFEHLRTVLAELGYRGFLLKDSPDLPIQSNLEKLLSAIICSCFVIVLDKEASGHIAELGNMLQFRFRPVVVIRATSQPTTSFLEDQIVLDRNFRVVVEQNITAMSLLPHIQWAKSILKEKAESYNSINYWRKS